MARIHHNTVKKAQKLGFTLDVVENEVEVRLGDRLLASHASGSVAVELAIEKMNAAAPAPKKAAKKAAAPKKAAKPKKVVEDDEGEGDEDGEVEAGDEEEENEGGSLVKKKYKQAYRPFHDRCGDDLSQQISDHVTVEDEDGNVRIDRVLLRRFAKANDVWADRYNDLNNGMARMNIANRLRARIRKGHEVVWP